MKKISLFFQIFQTQAITSFDSDVGHTLLEAWGSVVGSNPSRVTGDFFRSIRQVHVPGVDSASKNEYQDISGGKGGRCVMVTTLPPSCAECLEILEP